MTPPAPSSHDELIDLAGQLAEVFSFNRSVGQIFGCLFVSPHPLSLEEISQGCKMSKGNASTHLRTLHNWGAVHRAPKLGTRKDHYRAETDLIGLAGRRLHDGANKRITYLRDTLNTLKSKPLNSADPEQRTYWLDRLHDLDRILSKVEKAYALAMESLQMRKMF